MNAQIKTLADFLNAEKAIGEKTMAYIQQVGWEKAEEVLSEALEVFKKAHEGVLEILEREDFERWFQLGLELNEKDYPFYSDLGIESEARQVREAYTNKDLLREVFNVKVRDYKEYKRLLSLSA